MGKKILLLFSLIIVKVFTKPIADTSFLDLVEVPTADLTYTIDNLAQTNDSDISNKNCEYGFHSYFDSKSTDTNTRCVDDVSYNCSKYDQSLGKCNECIGHYYLTQISTSDHGKQC